MLQLSQESIRGAIAHITKTDIAERHSLLVRFVDEQALPFSWAQIAQGLVNDAEFRERWNQTWADLPFDFEWKPVPIHPYTAESHPFFAIAFPATFRPPNPNDFLSHLQDLPPNQLTATFKNFSGDAELLVPQVTGEYGHIAAFCRTAGTVAMHELWQQTGELCSQAIAQKTPVWCNTHGHGVPWLHIRFDQRLKYASFPPRGSISANSQAIWYQQIYQPAMAAESPQEKGPESIAAGNDTVSTASGQVDDKPQNRAWVRFKRDRMAMLGAITLIALLTIVLLGPLGYSASYSEIDFTRALSAPDLTHPLGTNDLGQDQLARLLWGGRISMAVGITAMLVSISIGTLIGTVAGFCGGLVDNLLMRLTDLFLSLPQLPLLLLIIYLFRDAMRQLVGPETGIFLLIILVVGGLTWMPAARLVRAGFLATKERDFVQAAKSLGATPSRIVWRHILPNVIGPVIVAATLGVGNAIITESTLSFLGIGFPPDVPTWGRMLFDGQNYIASAPHLVIFPGLAIFLTVLSVNYVGDGLRDALDVRSH